MIENLKNMNKPADLWLFLFEEGELIGETLTIPAIIRVEKRPEIESVWPLSLQHL